MLNRGNPQSNFFDAEIFAKMIPEDHPLTRIKKNVDFSFVTEVVADKYSLTEGRPSFPPERLFRALFLEIWGNLSDIQVCRELSYNVLYRWFCGISFDDPVPDDTTLVVFRRRLGEEKFRELFVKVVDEARVKGLLRGKWAVVDGTKLVADVAVKNTLQLVREGRRRIIHELGKHDATRADVLKDYKEPLADGDYPTRDELLAAEIRKGHELACEVRRAPTSEALAEVVDMYEQVLSGGSGVGSLVDPEARWGFKNKREPFLGYKVHAACDEAGIVTAAAVSPGNESELSHVGELLSGLSEVGVRPKKFAADKGYDSFQLIGDLVAAGLHPYISRRSKSVEERLGEFRYEQTAEGPKVTCPCGVASLNCTPHRAGGYTVFFSEKDCKRCKVRQSCLGTPTRTRKVMYVNPALEANRPRGMLKAKRVRTAIERVFADAKRWHLMARARYRGRARVAVQVLMTMIVLNTKKMVATA